MAKEEARGKVITFYSYKGGTGRTMALANVACLLAQDENAHKGVLVVDWDLEAPGLHKYFTPSPSNPLAAAVGGLIDLFWEVNAEIAEISTQTVVDEDDVRNILEKIHIKQYMQETDIKNVYIMQAGRFEDDYPARVNSFRWDDFYNNSPGFFRIFAEYLTEYYDYVLIDSRTGITDTSGICTMIMPEKLIIVFLTNEQSLTGVADLVNRSIAFRKSSDDLRPLTIYPLPSRIESTLPTLIRQWRYGDPLEEIKGYQEVFETLLSQVYKLPSCDLNDYFDKVQIQYIPFYSYGEKIAVQLERSEESLSLAQSYERFTLRLIKSLSPWDPWEKSAETYGPSPLEQARQIKESLENAERLFYSGRYSEAITLYDQILSLDPRSQRAREHRAQAEEYVKGLIPMVALPVEAGILFMKAQSAMLEGNFAASKEFLMAARDTLAKNKIVRWQEGQEFEVKLERLIAADQSFKASQQLFETGQVDKAIKMLELAITVSNNPDYEKCLSLYLEFRIESTSLLEELDDPKIELNTFIGLAARVDSLRQQHGYIPAIKALLDKMEIAKSQVIQSVCEEASSILESAQMAAVVDDAVEFSGGAKQILELARTIEADNSILLELLQRAEFLNRALLSEALSLNAALRTVDKSTWWPLSDLSWGPSLAWKLSSSVRKKYPADTKVLLLKQKIRSHLLWLALATVIDVTVVSLLWYVVLLIMRL